jgi:hypothetical protein
MKIKTMELTGVALDWAVAKCEGRSEKGMAKILAGTNLIPAEYSTNWEQGGPIIEREGVDLDSPVDLKLDEWMATSKGFYLFGPTPLIAAMRCYVASKLGDEVEIPKELT